MEKPKVKHGAGIAIAVISAAVLLGLGIFLFFNTSVKSFYITQKATALHNQGRYDDAITAYESLIKLNPNDGNNYWNMAVAYLQKGDKASARRQVTILRKMHANDLVTMLEDLITRN